MKRKDAIAHIKVAGYHGDTKTAMRIYTEHRISFQTYTEAFARGRELKAEGMPCTCTNCAKAAAMTPVSPECSPSRAYLATVRFPDGRIEYTEFVAVDEADALQKAGWAYVREAVVLGVKLLPEDMRPASLLMELVEFGEVRNGYNCLREAGGRYVMEDTRNVFNRHSLAVDATSEARLEAHWAGFVENNL